MIKNERKWAVGLQTKILLFILPILISSLLISDIISRRITNNALTESGKQMALYKADQIEQYTLGQWEILVQNEFYNQEIYRIAAFDSVNNYISGLVSTNQELIMALDREMVIAVGNRELHLDDVSQDIFKEIYINRTVDWINIEFNNQLWVGHTFYFEPFQWQFFILEEKSSFYSEISKITLIENIILLVLTILSVLCILYFVRFLLKPLKRVTQGIKYISSSKKFDRKVKIEL